MIAHLTVGDRWRIVSLRQGYGTSPNRIACIVHCGIATVFRILRLYQERNNVIERSGRGRIGKLNNKQIHTLRQLGFHAVHARSQPLIRETLAQQRLNFCLQHARDNWQNVIFSDEKAFEVDTSGVVYCIPAGRPRPTQFQSQVKYRVIIFGAIWYHNRSRLVLIEGRTNTNTYVQYLSSALNSHLRS